MNNARLILVNYDGINLFYNGKWTGIEFDSFDTGQDWLDFLNTLRDDQIKQFIQIWKLQRER